MQDPTLDVHSQQLADLPSHDRSGSLPHSGDDAPVIRRDGSIVSSAPASRCGISITTRPATCPAMGLAEEFSYLLLLTLLAQGLRKSVPLGPTIRQALSFGRDLGIEPRRRPVPVLDDVVLVIKLSKALQPGVLRSGQSSPSGFRAVVVWSDWRWDTPVFHVSAAEDGVLLYALTVTTAGPRTAPAPSPTNRPRVPGFDAPDPETRHPPRPAHAMSRRPLRHPPSPARPHSGQTALLRNEVLDTFTGSGGEVRDDHPRSTTPATAWH